MRRRLLNVLTGLSVLLCAGACALWARSYWVRDEVYRDRRVGNHSGGRAVVMSALSTGGEFDARVEWMDHPWTPGSNPQWWPPAGREWTYSRWRRDPQREAADWPNWRFGFDRIRRPGLVIWTFATPLWMPAAAFALLPLARLARVALKRTRQPGTCARCGYDLRTTPGRCPECGTTVPAGGAGTNTATASDPAAPDDPPRRAA